MTPREPIAGAAAGLGLETGAGFGHEAGLHFGRVGAPDGGKQNGNGSINFAFQKDIVAGPLAGEGGAGWLIRSRSEIDDRSWPVGACKARARGEGYDCDKNPDRIEHA